MGIKTAIIALGIGLLVAIVYEAGERLGVIR